MRLPNLLILPSALLLSACVTLPDGGRPDVAAGQLSMRFVRVPAGEFVMGRAESIESLARAFPQYGPQRLRQLADETPAHPVRITRAFDLGRYEVTVGQFRKFVELSGYVPESERDGTGAYGFNPFYDPARSPHGDTFEGRDPKYSWRNPGFAQDESHPVVNVTWHDAVALADWLTEQEGRRYRLPTEAEWEYACLAGTQTRYYNGDDPRALARIANAFDPDTARHWPHWEEFALEQRDKFAFTAPVGSFAPNDFGLYDMIGNVWEWTADWHDDNYYAVSPLEDPQGPETGDVRVRRGGSWHTWPLYLRCAFRNWNTPQTRYPLVGFRLLREVDE